MIEAEGFERFLHKRFPGTKRFGLDGGEAMVPALEQIIIQNARTGGRESGMIEPGLGRKLLESFQEQSKILAEKDKTLVVVTSPVLRRELSTLVRQAAPDALVLSYREIPENKRINVAAIIGGSEA